MNNSNRGEFFNDREIKLWVTVNFDILRFPGTEKTWIIIDYQRKRVSIFESQSVTEDNFNFVGA
jgi:hypothetical protein